MNNSLVFLTLILSIITCYIVAVPASYPIAPACIDPSNAIGSVPCAPWQTYDCSADTQPLRGTLCTNWQANSCCDAGTAKRAINWALEDDGCGVVGGTCLQKLVDIACHMNCAPNIINGTLLTQAGASLRPQICGDWADSAWDACQSYSWCGTNQLETSTCQFKQVKRTQTRSRTVVSTEIVNAYDTCTLVARLTPIEFSEQILNIIRLDNDARCISGDVNYGARPKFQIFSSANYSYNYSLMLFTIIAIILSIIMVN
jgi:hypothetical protein